MKGLAYVFLRRDGAPLPPGCAGHVGWGFQLDASESFYCGSTENPTKQPVVLPGSDNGAWAIEAVNESSMIEAMKERNYDGYKLATVRDFNSAEARRSADETRSRGYLALTNNCLDHVWDVLAAYGVKGLPWAQTHPSPNDWFAVFNGEYHNIS